MIRLENRWVKWIWKQSYLRKEGKIEDENSIPEKDKVEELVKKLGIDQRSLISVKEGFITCDNIGFSYYGYEY